MEHIISEQKELVSDLCKEFSDVVYFSGDKLTCTTSYIIHVKKSKTQCLEPAVTQNGIKSHPPKFTCLLYLTSLVPNLKLLMLRRHNRYLINAIPYFGQVEKEQDESEQIHTI